MLYQSGLAKRYWGEALNAAVYIYNRTPHSGLEGFKTPYEAKYDKKPDISNIRTWGSIAYKRQPPLTISKLDPRAIKHVLVGYGSNQYKIANPTNHFVSWYRDVYIHENSFINKALPDTQDNTENEPLEISREEDSIETDLVNRIGEELTRIDKFI